MHRIAYATIPKDDDRVALLKRISAEVARKSDADDEYTGSLWRTDHWHDDVTYPSRQEAEKAIKDMDNGFYDDHAVLFYDTSKVPETDRMKTLRDRIDRLESRRCKAETDSDIHHRKSKSITCRKCGSVIMLHYYWGHCACPVCGTDLRSESVRKRIHLIESALKRTKSELKSEQDKRFEACPVKWLVKYEYHC